MSLCLNRGTKPEGLEIKMFPMGGQVVLLGDYEITMEDFLIAVHYVLTNTNLTEGDPRLQFVECVRSMQVTKGHTVVIQGKKFDTKCLVSSVPPVLDE